MLGCIPVRSRKLKEARRAGAALELTLENGVQRIVPVSEGSVRILFSEKEFGDVNALKPGIVSLPPFENWSYREDGQSVYVELPKLLIEIDKESNRFRYFDVNGRLLLQERAKRSKELEEIPVYRMDEREMKKEYVDTPDGRKEVVREAAKIQTGSAYHTRLHLQFDENEALYGLGQHEEGYGSLRGNRIYLNQANRRIAIPMFVSTKGYGILVNTYAPAIFNDTKEGTYLYTETDPEMDFFFMNGEGCDGVIREYRKVTGKAALLPKWAFGYMQSQERYETQEEILEVTKEYRRRGIGLDCIVLDWCSWPDGQWGQKSFDESRFPDPDAMTDELHEEHTHFMISVWPNLTEGTPNYEEFRGKGLLLPGINNYDAVSKEGRRVYWNQLEKGLFGHGIDAWWCDNSEPFTPEWNTLIRPENSKSYEEYCKTAACHLPASQINAYGFYHAQGIYEGQRGYYERMRNAEAGGAFSGTPADGHAPRKITEKRVVNLTRSGYIGQQRFGTILWSGDISASWETLRRQIAAGIHFCASGLPYWTVDIGAFFVKNGLQWFWDGEYDRGPEDPAYCELFTRWYQWGAFLPVFRGHGTDFRRELWMFDRPEAPFYEALLKANRLRYELMPYIYSAAGLSWERDGLIMRPLAFGFPEDERTFGIVDQYLFGDALMVCPVTEAMYFGADQKEESGRLSQKAGREEKQKTGGATREVYLPAGCDWYDYWTKERYAGGQVIEAAAPLDRIPLFVKAGSILVKAEPALSVEEQSGEYSVEVYAGADATYLFYEDEGDGYGYEKGQYRISEFVWKDGEGVLQCGGIEKVTLFGK